MVMYLWWRWTLAFHTPVVCKPNHAKEGNIEACRNSMISMYALTPTTVIPYSI